MLVRLVLCVVGLVMGTGRKMVEKVDASNENLLSGELKERQYQINPLSKVEETVVTGGRGRHGLVQEVSSNRCSDRNN